jgi:hypothetical protein
VLSRDLQAVLLGRLLMGFPIGDGLPFAEHARRDRQRGMDERDLDMPVPLDALDER